MKHQFDDRSLFIILHLLGFSPRTYEICRGKRNPEKGGDGPQQTGATTIFNQDYAQTTSHIHLRHQNHNFFPPNKAPSYSLNNIT